MNNKFLKKEQDTLLINVYSVLLQIQLVISINLKKVKEIIMLLLFELRGALTDKPFMSKSLAENIFFSMLIIMLL